MQRRLLSALSVTRHGCRSPRRRMATDSTGISVMPAIRMGSCPRKPMVSRRFIRCGVREHRYFSGLWLGRTDSGCDARRRSERSGRRFAFLLEWLRSHGTQTFEGLQSRQDPFAPRPARQTRARKKKPATPAGMTAPEGWFKSSGRERLTGEARESSLQERRENGTRRTT